MFSVNIICSLNRITLQKVLQLSKPHGWFQVTDMKGAQLSLLLHSKLVSFVLFHDGLIMAEEEHLHGTANIHKSKARW